jgi:hypothetical protein
MRPHLRKGLRQLTLFTLPFVAGVVFVILCQRDDWLNYLSLPLAMIATRLFKFLVEDFSRRI